MSKYVLMSILFIALSPSFQALENPEVLPLHAIQPGMKATAKTVFEGYHIEEFDLEIIGILRNFIGTEQHVIVAKLLGDKVDFSGVVSGMSGSPVYIDNKLIGAIAYRFGVFQKEPIAGITPIEGMLEIQKYSGSSNSIMRFEMDIDPGKLKQDLKPIATPLIFGGMHQSVFNHYADYFEAMGFLPLQGGGSGGEKEDFGTFEPGAAVAAILVSGDMDISGTGTLTYRKDNRVLAFGHPFLMSGPTEIPMARAKILYTLASSLASFKMSNTSEIIGAILQDRLTAVEGEIGKTARMIPVVVHAKKNDKLLRSFHYDMINHRRLSQILLSLTISNSIANTLFYSEDISIFAELQISIRDNQPFYFKKLYTVEKNLSSLPFLLAADVGQKFSAIFKNRFEEPHIQKIEVTLDIQEGIQSATLERVWYEKDRAAKGESIIIKAYFRSFRGKRHEETFSVQIPSEVKQKKLKVILGSPIAVDRLRGKIFQNKLHQAKNLSEYTRILNEQPVNHQIILLLSEPSQGAMVEGSLLPNLPPTIASVLSSERGGKSVLGISEHILYETVRSLKFNISGVKTFTIDIE